MSELVLSLLLVPYSTDCIRHAAGLALIELVVVVVLDLDVRRSGVSHAD